MAIASTGLKGVRPYVKLSTEPVDISVDELREWCSSADSAGQFRGLVKNSPLEKTIFKISELSCAASGSGRAGGNPARVTGARLRDTQPGSAHLPHQFASTTWPAKRFTC
jgi:hypothetical protein